MTLFRGVVKTDNENSFTAPDFTPGFFVGILKKTASGVYYKKVEQRMNK